MTVILLVEDAAEIARLVDRTLSLSGYGVIVAPDGEQGLSAFADGKPDLVLLDLMLPDIDGVEICRQMRQMEAEAGRPRVPILMLTALTAAPDREAGFEAGADDYLAKPFGIGDLLERVRDLVPEPARPDGDPADG